MSQRRLFGLYAAACALMGALMVITPHGVRQWGDIVSLALLSAGFLFLSIREGSNG